MASSRNTKVTFAMLPREVRDNIYKHMFTEPKTIETILPAGDYGQPEDWRILRGMLHACRTTPRFVEEAFEAYFEINTFRIEAEHDLGFLNRPAYYVKGRGYIPMMESIKTVEAGLSIATNQIAGRDTRRLCKCFRDLLACPALRRVTVKVELLGERNIVPTNAVANEADSAKLDTILTVATGSYRRLKEKVGAGLKFDSRHQRFKETIEAWEERVGKATVEKI